MKPIKNFQTVHAPKIFGNQQNSYVSIVKIVTIRDVYTRIEFLFTSTKNNQFFGVNKSIYIRPTDTDLKLRVKEMYGINYYPDCKFLKKNETVSYNIYFEPLPFDTKVIDIVENRFGVIGLHNISLISLNNEHSKLISNFNNN